MHTTFQHCLPILGQLDKQKWWQLGKHFGLIWSWFGLGLILVWFNLNFDFFCFTWLFERHIANFKFNRLWIFKLVKIPNPIYIWHNFVSEVTSRLQNELHMEICLLHTTYIHVQCTYIYEYAVCHITMYMRRILKIFSSFITKDIESSWYKYIIVLFMLF